MRKPWSERLFLTIALVHLLFLVQEWATATAVTKALLLPTLLLFYTQQLQKPWSAFQKGIILALGLSFLGDVLLIRGNEPLFFMTGLAAFLGAQLTYTRNFLRKEGAQAGLLRTQPWWAVPVLAFGVGIYFYLYPGLGSMWLPVLVYVLAILAMVLAVVNRLLWSGPAAAGWLMAGALLFLASDAILAIKKFGTPLPLAGFWVMLTYILAQYALVKGCLAKEMKSGALEI